MIYDDFYKNNANVFGREPERILVQHSHLISEELPVLDIGAGQGRNSVYLSKMGYNVEAIDTSFVSIQFLEKIKEKEKLNFKVFHSDFKDYIGKTSYYAVLVFGLIQILDWKEIDFLKRKLSGLLREGGLLFITAFTTLDNSCKNISESSKKIGRNSYLKPDGEKRTFFEPGELKSLFQNYKVINYWEGMGPEHRHGNNPVERHALVEAVFQKKKF
jgi:tellurite methyltransferase